MLNGAGRQLERNRGEEQGLQSSRLCLSYLTFYFSKSCLFNQRKDVLGELQLAALQ